MMTIVKSLIYVMSFGSGEKLYKIDPCDNITSTELALGCSTVGGKRLYSQEKLVDIAKNSK